MRITVTLKKLSSLLQDLNVCMVDPVTLRFAYVAGKRNEFSIDLTDSQVAKLKDHIDNEELKRRYAR